MSFHWTDIIKEDFDPVKFNEALEQFTITTEKWTDAEVYFFVCSLKRKLEESHDH